MTIDDDVIRVDVETVKAETEKAILVEIEGEEIWVPKSQIHDDSEVYSQKSGGGTLVVSRWWADQRGLT